MAGGLLAVLGVLTLGVGLYFLVARPPLLPEDIRFIGVSADHLPPRLSLWLGIVFRTWGGFMFGFGIQLVAVAGWVATRRSALLAWGTALATLIAFGQFFLSNVTIRSEFVAFVGGVFGLAVLASVSLILWWIRARRR